MTWTTIIADDFSTFPEQDLRVLISVKFVDHSVLDEVMIGKCEINPMTGTWFNDDGFRVAPNTVVACQLLPEPHLDKLIHFVFVAKSHPQDYFMCSADAQEGGDFQSTNWNKVNCPDCLKRKPVPVHPRRAPLDDSLDVWADAIVDGKQAGD